MDRSIAIPLIACARDKSHIEQTTKLIYEYLITINPDNKAWLAFLDWKELEQKSPTQCWEITCQAIENLPQEPHIQGQPLPLSVKIFHELNRLQSRLAGILLLTQFDKKPRAQYTPLNATTLTPFWIGWATHAILLIGLRSEINKNLIQKVAIGRSASSTPALKQKILTETTLPQEYQQWCHQLETADETNLGKLYFAIEYASPNQLETWYDQTQNIEL